MKSKILLEGGKSTRVKEEDEDEEEEEVEKGGKSYSRV